MATVEKTIWLSYDLGIDGDYENLYTWLDQLKARECGDSLAVLKYKIEFESDLPSVLLDDLKSLAALRNKDRIYIIYRDKGKIKGRFITGKRKSPPWEGYAKEYFEEIEEVDE